jgi:GNAT superfamily N-acetyltransferase
MPVVDVTVFYLEMLAPNHKTAAPPRDGLAVLHARKPTVAYYRFLYNAVGRDYYWYSRGKLPDAELAATVQHPLNEVHVLHVDGAPAGFAELDRRKEGEIELVQFGLMPEFVGQGLGKYFLQWTIDKAWGYRPRRFWLHTCTLDHPAALPNYLKAGFVVYKEEMIKRELPG